jgi:hypothetical protein
MSDLRPDVSPWPVVDGIRQWWRNWCGANSGVLERFGDCEVERMAHDLCMSVTEFRSIADRGPESGDLLERRMNALDLNSGEIAATEPGTSRDLQRLCTLCESHRQCMRDLARDPAGRAWEDYCPNAAMLKELDTLPWASRREW